MLSTSGQCRPFDAAADGYVRGEGCGVVVLKPLAAARRDGDRVLAVVRGSAVAQDGRSNGLTAPNGAAQRQVIRHALARAGVAPDSVGYVEAHGTGTPLGDPIELRALADCYGGGAATGSMPCAVGAVKAFIGHLEGAAGIAGLIKAVLVLRHGWIPGAPWLHTANPRAGLVGSRLVLAKEGRAWEPSPVRRAAVSSFGFGGTLAHVVLEAGDPLPVPETGAADPGPQLLLLSAADPAALGQFVHAYAHMPSQGQAVDWPALCAGAALRRAHLPWRTALVADGGALAAQLAAWREGDAARPSGPDVPAIAFAFTGPDDARPGMGRGLYRRFPAFRTAVDALDEVLHAELGTTAAALLCDAAPSNATARPLCLLLQLGLLRLWQSWGLRPTALWGEGVGAHAASVAAGTLSAADALRLAIADAPLPPGAAAPPALQDGWVLEIGPAPLLRAPGATSALAQGGADDALVAAVLRCAGQLFMAGLPLDWAAVYAGASPARDLPLYPFARTVHRDLPSSVPQRLPATYACEWLDLGPVTNVADMAAGMPPRVVWVADPATSADDPLADALRRALPASALEVRPWSELHGLRVGVDSLVLVQCMARPGEPAAQAALRLGEGLLAGLRALEQSGGRCRVWAVSRQAAALPQDADSSAEAACVQGIGRVAALEMPHLWGGLFDVPPDLAADDVARCLPALWAVGEDQIALRAGRRFAARLRPASLPPGTPPLVLDASLAYWVVGGGGALGRRVLRSLKAAGARHLIVSGRRAAPPDELASLGVQYLQADIADPRQVKQVLAELDRQGLALGGIVHAAGEASEHPIAQLSAERFRAVAEAKVQGAWNLHELTLHRPSLRFFVCFASVSGLWGSGGQAHYAAANHFLDALCEHRRRRGLPALAIDWGPWGGGGLVDAEVERRLRQAGLDPLSPEAAMALFERLLAQGGQGPARIAVADVRWPDFAAGFTARRDSPLLSELLPPPADGPAAGLRGTPEQVAARIRSAVAAAVTAQLGADRVPDADRGLFDQGLDSLAMVAIHQRLTAELGIAFARADMFSYGSVNALADRLLALWQREQGAVPSTEPALQPVAPDAAVPASAMRSGDIVAAIEAEMAALGLSG
jgi:acyl transferase domain-containing protein/acyl carrier protein